MTLETVAANIVNYLASEAPAGRAALLSGPWGAGKTHLFKTIILPKLREREPKKEIVYISAFGLGSIDRLQGAILAAHAGRAISNKSDAKDSGDAQHFSWKDLGRIGASFVKAGTDKYLPIKLPLDSILQLALPSRMVICIDDIERCSEKMPLSEILGLVSWLVEFKAARVLLIANEDKMTTKNDGATFNLYREKVISRVFRISPSVPDVYPLFCHQVSNQEVELSALEARRELILAAFHSSGEQNLRTLLRILEHLVEVNRVEGVEIQDEHIILLCSLIIENDRGALQEKAFYDFSPLALHARSFIRGQTVVEETPPLTFYKTYFGMLDRYSFVPSLYDYVKNGHLDPERLVAEISPPADSRTGAEEICGRINDMDTFFLSDDDIEILLQKAEQFILSNEAMTAGQIIGLACSYKHYCRAIERSVPPNVEQRISTRVRECAEKGDDSFGGRNRVTMEGMQEILAPYEALYRPILAMTKTSAQLSSLKLLIEKFDEYGFLKFLDEEEVEPALFKDEVLWVALASIRQVHGREFFHMIGSMIARGKRNQGTEVINDIERRLNEMLSSTSSKMDGIRFRALLGDVARAKH